MILLGKLKNSKPRSRDCQLSCTLVLVWSFPILKDISYKKNSLLYLKEILKLYIKLYYKLLPYILLSFQNISTEKSELFAIFDYWGYTCYVKRGMTLIFCLESKWLIWVQKFVSGCSVAVWNLEMIKNIPKNSGSLILSH